MSCDNGKHNFHLQMETFSTPTLVFMARDTEKSKWFFFSFVMDVLRTWEEKQPLEPSIYLSSLCLLDIKDITSLKLSPSKRGQKLGQAQRSTASCPAPPLLHWGIYEVTMVRNKLDQVSGNALWLSAPSVLGDPGIMGQTEKCDDKKS